MNHMQESPFWRKISSGLGSIAVVAIGVASCNGCGSSPAGGGEADAVVELVAPQVSGEDIPIPGDVYREAYERALRELTHETMADRLRAIEREIASERSSLE
jgi:hypothetical protein